MNLHAIVAGAIDAVNPRERMTIERSTGYTTAPSGARTPAYDPPRQVLGQVQSLTFGDLRQVEGLNLDGTKRAIYLEGHWEGLVRSESKGGDLITRQDGTVWLVAMVLEQWRGWTKVAVTQQNGG